jgi:hypothetical protein
MTTEAKLLAGSDRGSWTRKGRKQGAPSASAAGSRNPESARRTAALWLSICAALLAACGLGQNSPPRARILFIGNSYTYFNDGVDHELEGLAPTAATARLAQAGYSLEDHWNDGEAVSLIQDGSWDYVVLQEQSQRPVLDQARFYNFARALNGTIRETGAQTILMMTWERPDSVSGGVNTANLAAAYNQVGERLGARVAPIGLAFARSRIERPSLVLYSEDGHPTVFGTYLAACVLYGVVYGETPFGNSYAGSGITADDAAYLQQVAAETLGY